MQCSQWLAQLADLRLCEALRGSVDALYQGSLQGLDAALRQSCTAFQGGRFARVGCPAGEPLCPVPALGSAALQLPCCGQVLEGHAYLGSLQQLGAELATAFTNALDEACLLHARSAMTHLDSSTPRLGSLQVLPRLPRLPAALWRGLRQRCKALGCVPMSSWPAALRVASRLC